MSSETSVKVPVFASVAELLDFVGKQTLREAYRLPADAAQNAASAKKDLEDLRTSMERALQSELQGLRDRKDYLLQEAWKAIEAFVDGHEAPAGSLISLGAALRACHDRFGYRRDLFTLIAVVGLIEAICRPSGDAGGDDSLNRDLRALQMSVVTCRTGISPLDSRIRSVADEIERLSTRVAKEHEDRLAQVFPGA